jgi:hypothetical protein
MRTIQMMAFALLCAMGTIAQANTPASIASQLNDAELEIIHQGDLLLNRGTTRFEISLNEAAEATDLAFRQILSRQCAQRLLISDVQVLEAKELPAHDDSLDLPSDDDADEPSDDGLDEPSDDDEEKTAEASWLKLGDILPYKGINLHQNKEVTKFNKVRFNVQHNGRFRQRCNLTILKPSFEVPRLEKHTGELTVPETCDEEAECLLSFETEEQEESFEISEESAKIFNFSSGRYLLTGYRDATSENPEHFFVLSSLSLPALPIDNDEPADEPSDDDADEPSDDDADEPSDDDADEPSDDDSDDDNGDGDQG